MRRSALGHEQTSRHVCVMSAIPLKADIHQRRLHVRLVPLADIAADERQANGLIGKGSKKGQLSGSFHSGIFQTFGLHFWLPDCHERARGLRLRPAASFYFGVFASRKSRTVASSCSFVTSNTFSMYCFACDTELVEMET